jgi:hypothetical protein
VLVLAPVCVLALLSAAVVDGVLHSGRGAQRQAVHGAAGASARANRDFAPNVDRAGVTPPTPGRHQDYEAWMTLRVKDPDALTERTNDAMRVVRSFGGYVETVQQSSGSDGSGEADLRLRVPVGRVEEALVQLSGLGSVLSRQVSIVDLEQTLGQQRARILRLRLYIARALAELKTELPADVRLRLQLQLQSARDALAQTTRSNRGTLKRAALSTVSLTLTTQKAAAPVHSGGSGRFGRAAHEAGAFLAGTGAVVLFLLIVLSPVIVLVGAFLLGLRAYRRREERRLLAT